MNEQALESFIAVCDDMMVPAQESLKTIKQKHDEATEKIRNIKEKIKEDDDITKIIALNNECISELNKYIKLIKEDKESPLDKVKEYSGAILGIFGIAGLEVVSKSDNIKGKYIAIGASAISLIGAVIGLRKTTIKYFKGHTKLDYERNITNLKTTIELANVVLEEAKRLNINKYSDLSEHYTISFNNLTPVITKDYWDKEDEDD